MVTWNFKFKFGDCSLCSVVVSVAQDTAVKHGIGSFKSQNGALALVFWLKQILWDTNKISWCLSKQLHSNTLRTTVHIVIK